MEKFNLDKYLADPSHKVVTRDGNPVRIICTDAKKEYPIVALVEMDGREYIINFLSNGTKNPLGDDKLDLFFAPKKREGFINVYYRNNKYLTGDVIHNTEKEAKHLILPNCGYIATIKIAWGESVWKEN